jgi:transketolase
MPPEPSSNNRSAAACAQTLRRWIVERSLAANVGHIGSAMSIADILATLWTDVLTDPGSEHPDRDRFLLGKGHASLALYCVLRWAGTIDQAALETFCGDGSLLGVHPEAALDGVDVSTGSLGQALSMGVGNALALRARGSSASVWVLLSDAECNEGQVWEAAQFAAHHGLDNLRVVVDLNGLQAMGHTREIIDLGGMAPIWSAFGWDVVSVDGHDVDALARELNGAGAEGCPRVFLARTLLGKGVSFMEDRLEWHYRNLSPEQADQALSEIGQGA